MLSRLIDALARFDREAGLLSPIMAVMGLVALVAAPFLVGQIFSRPPPVPGDRADPGQVSAPAFAVSSPSGAQIGALQVEYPRSMRENEARPVTLRYVATRNWQGEFAAYPDVRIEASLGGARMTIVPEPTRYAFSNARISARGADDRGWEISPQAEGDYRLHLRLEVAPGDFPVVPILANGERAAAGNDLSLPITVYTRYSVPQAWVDAAKGAAGLLAFLLTLPAAAGLARRFLGAPAAPAPAPAMAPRPARAKRGGRKGRGG